MARRMVFSPSTETHGFRPVLDPMDEIRPTGLEIPLEHTRASGTQCKTG